MREVTDDEDRDGLVGDDGGAPHQGAQPGDDLLEAERLGDVVVAAGGQAGHPVLDRVLGGQEEHRHVGVVAAHPAQHLEAVEVGEHHVERHRVGLELAGGPDRSDAGGRGADLPALVAQRHAQQLGEVVLVVDDEDPDGRAVEALELGGGGLLRVHAPRKHRNLVRRPRNSCANPVSPLCPILSASTRLAQCPHSVVLERGDITTTTEAPS